MDRVACTFHVILCINSGEYLNVSSVFLTNALTMCLMKETSRMDLWSVLFIRCFGQLEAHDTPVCPSSPVTVASHDPLLY